jgi:F-type H+-transporting ATPase subunit b
VLKIISIIALLFPAILFAAGAGEETDTVQRIVNFIIFAAIIYYLLAHRVKAYFAGRTASIQAELDKVQDTLKASEAKVEDAKAQLENAKKIAAEIVAGANLDIDKIKDSVSRNVTQEINYMQKTFNEKLEIELKKAKKEVVAEVLEELLDSKNIDVTNEELASIVLKKVA